jgi:hypothetical protein
MICSSENLPLRIVRLLREVIGLYPILEEFAGLRSARKLTRNEHVPRHCPRPPARRALRSGAYAPMS